MSSTFITVEPRERLHGVDAQRFTIAGDDTGTDLYLIHTGPVLRHWIGFAYRDGVCFFNTEPHADRARALEQLVTALYGRKGVRLRISGEQSELDFDAPDNVVDLVARRSRASTIVPSIVAALFAGLVMLLPGCTQWFTSSRGADYLTSAVSRYCREPIASRVQLRDTVNAVLADAGHAVRVDCGDPSPITEEGSP